MRKRLFIFAGVLLLAVLGAMLARHIAGGTAPPDVKVTFLGLTNSSAGPNVATSTVIFPIPPRTFRVPNASMDARFQVLNRSGRPIRVFTVGIRQCEPYESLSWPGARLGKPIAVEPGASNEVLTPFMANAPRWRGCVTVQYDTPKERFRQWLVIQTWRRYLPAKLVPDRGVTYTYYSQWVDKPPGQPDGAYPAIPSPLDSRSTWRKAAEAVD
jgi:hypothetical protein